MPESFEREAGVNEQEGFSRLLRDAGDLLQLPDGFFDELQNESDWSFVIRIHALMEAAIAHLLVFTLRDKRLDDVFDHMSLGGRTGKTAFAKALGLLGSDHDRFLQAFSALRNRLVHDVRQVNFSLKDHIGKMNTGEFNAFVRDFGYVQTNNEARERLARTEPKRLMLLGAVVITGLAYRARAEQQFDQLLQQASTVGGYQWRHSSHAIEQIAAYGFPNFGESVDPGIKCTNCGIPIQFGVDTKTTTECKIVCDTCAGPNPTTPTRSA